MSDTPIETAVKIATMEVAIFQLSKDVGEIKEGNKEIFKILNSLSNHHTETNGMLNLINANQARSESRWNQLQQERKEMLEKYEIWKADVDHTISTNKATINTLKWLVGILTSSGTVAFVGWLFKVVV